jgi:hypothetical protein
MVIQAARETDLSEVRRLLEAQQLPLAAIRGRRRACSVRGPSSLYVVGATVRIVDSGTVATAREPSRWLPVGSVLTLGAVGGAVAKFRGWRARRQEITRGRENGSQAEVLARLRVLLEQRR